MTDDDRDDIKTTRVLQGGKLVMISLEFFDERRAEGWVRACAEVRELRVKLGDDVNITLRDLSDKL